ncbi:SGNH/GDSL hydrolase family protein [Staphylococcus aureus]
MAEVNHRYLRDLEGEMYFPKTHIEAVIDADKLGKSSNLAGKNIVVFGDSNTELGNYPELVGETLGANIVKAGFYGCRMSDHTNNSYLNMASMQKMAEFIRKKDFTELVTSMNEYYANGGRDYRTQANALNNVNWDSIDLITVFFGGNDFGSSKALGTENDTTGATFKGAINKVIKSIHETLPTVRIVFICPMFRSRIYAVNGENSDENPNTAGIYFKEYIESIEGITKKNHVTSINLHNLSGINKYNADYYLSDGKHPNSLSYETIARIISNRLELLY